MPVQEFEARFSRNLSEIPPEKAASISVLDASAFGNRQGTDFQVFERCIGPALVFEQHDNRYEILRVNRQFRQFLRAPWHLPFTADDLIRSEGLSPEEISTLRNAIQEGAGKGSASLTLDDRAPGNAPLGLTLRLVGRNCQRSLFL